VRKDVQYVSRGAHKIERALERFSVNVQDKIVADVGASTGGFTDYVLRSGAKKVYCIDVGHDQLAESLKSDPRIENHEQVNI
jgi:23S rRNA (cytidine1920-2'-O)/16S rRNA (cytidine1409-2'-O)-methyltransferase